jgi:hypothetical protein
MFYKKKKTFFTQEDSSSYEESEEEEIKILFMGMKTQDDNHSEDEEEVNLGEEFICAIEELRKSKKQNIILSEQLLEFEETIKSREKEVSKIVSDSEQLIIELNTKLQETKRKEEILNKELNEKQQTCKILEVEIIQLKGKLEKGDIQAKFENNSKILNNILRSQRSSTNKTRLRYDPSIEQMNDKQPINYVDSLKNSIRREENKTSIIPLKTVPNKQISALPTKEKDDKKNRIIIRNPSNINQYIFLGYLYSYNNFGHKAIHCKAYRKYNPRNVQRYENNKNNVERRNYNSFSRLQDYNVECYK